MAAVTRVILNIVLIGLLNSCMAQTEPSSVCNSSDDTLACRYDCPAEVVQEHCTSEKEKDGHCCPGYYRTKISTCQECPEDHFMPHVNNCHCSCLLCAECDGRVNNTEETSCNHTTDTVCTLWNAPPSRAPSACPWIESTSNPTTQVPTTQVPTAEEVSVNTPRYPQESKSERTSLELAFLVIVGPFTFLVVLVFVLLVICIYRKCNKSDKKQRTVCDRCQQVIENGNGDQPAAPPAAPPGDQPAGPPAAPPAAPPGDQPVAPPAAPPAAPPGDPPGDPPGGGGPVAGQAGVQGREDANHDIGHVEPCESDSFLRPQEKHQRDQTTSV